MKTLREMMDLVESAQAPAEKQPVKSSITARIQQLLDSGATVKSAAMGRVGQITGTDGNMVYITTNRGKKAATSFESGDEVKIFKRQDGSYIVRNTSPAMVDFGWGGAGDGEHQLEETTPDAIAKVETLFRK